MQQFIIDTTDPKQDGILASFLSPGKGITSDFVFNDILLAYSHQPVVPSAGNSRPWDADWLPTDTFQLAIGPLNTIPTGGDYPLGVLLGVTITAASVANPTHITTSGAHNLVTNNYALIAGSTTTPSIDGLWQVTVIDGTHFTIPVNVTVTGTGTLYDATGVNALTPITTAAAMTTALNLTLTKQSLTNIAVTLLSAGNYLIQGTASGALTFYSPATNNLEPVSNAVVVQFAPGSSTTEAQSAIRLSQAAVAYSEPSTALPAAAIAASIAQAGDSTHNKIYALTLTAGTYGGTFSLSVTCIAPSAGTFGVTALGNVTASDLQIALVQATGLANTAFNVTRTNDVINVEFAGTQGHSNVPVISAANIDLLAPKGVSGTLNLNTFELFQQFAATIADELTFTLSIRRTRDTGEQAEYFITDAILKRNLIMGSLVPAGAPVYQTQAQADARYLIIRQNIQSADYTTLLTDSGKQIFHPAADTNNRTWTIDSNVNVPCTIGTAITFINDINTITIAITADTLTLAGSGTTGSRTLAANGIATAVKKTATSWIISGIGLT